MDSSKKILNRKDEKIVDILVCLDCIKNGGFKQYNFYNEQTLEMLSKKTISSLNSLYENLKNICIQSFVGGKK